MEQAMASRNMRYPVPTNPGPIMAQSGVCAVLLIVVVISPHVSEATFCISDRGKEPRRIAGAPPSRRGRGHQDECLSYPHNAKSASPPCGQLCQTEAAKKAARRT